MSKPFYDAYLFDLDGTLFDSVELIFRCYRHAASRHLGLLPDDDVWRRGLGTPLRVQFRAVSEDEALIEAMVVSYREYHREHHDSGVTLFPGVADVLETLAAGGARLGVVTSKLRAGAERGLALTGLLDRFDVVVSADDVARPKPDPEPVRTALERLGADPNGTVFVGDSPHDMASGRAAGVRTAAALWGPFAASELAPHRPDFLLRSLAELLAIEAI